MADEAGSFEVNGKRYSLAADLTMGEMCDAEQFFGVSFGDPDAKPSIRLAAALMFLSIRRQDPTVTVEDIRSLPADVFESFLAAGDAGPPAEENSESNASSGEPSANGGESLGELRRVTGSLGSDIGSDSDLVTSAT